MQGYSEQFLLIYIPITVFVVSKKLVKSWKVIRVYIKELFVCLVKQAAQWSVICCDVCNGQKLAMLSLATKCHFKTNKLNIKVYLPVLWFVAQCLRVRVLKVFDSSSARQHSYSVVFNTTIQNSINPTHTERACRQALRTYCNNTMPITLSGYDVSVTTVCANH